MELVFQTLDVFSPHCFGGNQLAVVWSQNSLPSDLMQNIAAEFAIAETIFLFKPESPAHNAAARIFTPKAELKFAGHPCVGAAFALARSGHAHQAPTGSDTITLELPIGLVRAVIEGNGARIASPQSLELGAEIDQELVAAACGLLKDDLVSTTHSARVVSCGASLILAEVASEDALNRAAPQFDVFEKKIPRSTAVGIHLYTKAGADGVDYNARMFAPNMGIPEDPATGAANLALTGLLVHCAAAPDVSLDLTISQGVKLGRPSIISTQARKQADQLVELWVGGSCIDVTRGMLVVPG